MSARFIAFALICWCSIATAAGAQTTVTVEWDPSPDRVAGYIVYVGHASGWYSQQFDVGNRTSFIFPNADPGRSYYFSVAAYASDRIVGQRSNEVFFLAGHARPSLPEPGAEADSTPLNPPAPRQSDAICASDGNCYGADTVARVGSADSLTLDGTGRLFFVEDRQRVRVVMNDTLLAEPALQAGPSAEFTDLILDPDFTRTHLAYLGVVETAVDGSRRLNIVRYREVAQTFGEGAVIVAGLPLPFAGDASLAMDVVGRLYAAMPASRGGDDVEPYAGMVLRFENSGRSVESDGANGPIYMPGYARPTSMVRAPITNELWLAGAAADAMPGFSRVLEGQPGLGATDAALILAEGAGDLVRVAQGSDGVLATPWMAANAFDGTVVSVVSGASGSDLYVAIASNDLSTPAASRIIKLRRK